MKSNVDLYLNADRTKVVKDGDPDAAFLLVNAGREIPDAEVEKMGAGLLNQAQEVARAAEAPAEAPAGEEKATAAPAEDKAVEAPAENKASKSK
jgi:hypothetical protein